MPTQSTMPPVTMLRMVILGMLMKLQKQPHEVTADLIDERVDALVDLGDLTIDTAVRITQEIGRQVEADTLRALIDSVATDHADQVERERTRQSKARARSLAELMGTKMHDTALDGLHPWLRSKLEGDAAVIESVRFGTLDELGDAAETVTRHYFAAVDKTGDAAYKMGIPHTRPGYMGQMVDLGEVPGPCMFLVHSRSSEKVATVWVQFHEVNAKGYGDIATATFHVDALHMGTDAARDRVKAVSHACIRWHSVADKLGVAEGYNGDGNPQDF